MLTDMALPYRTYTCRCVMSSYLRRLLVVYLSVKAMRRPRVTNKQLEVCVFCVCMCCAWHLNKRPISSQSRKRLENDSKTTRRKEQRKSSEREVAMPVRVRRRPRLLKEIYKAYSHYNNYSHYKSYNNYMNIINKLKHQTL